MKLKISDKITSKKEILLYQENSKQYFTITENSKGFSIAKKVKVGDTVDIITEKNKEENKENMETSFSMVEDLKLQKKI